MRGAGGKGIKTLGRDLEKKALHPPHVGDEELGLFLVNFKSSFTSCPGSRAAPLGTMGGPRYGISFHQGLLLIFADTILKI